MKMYTKITISDSFRDLIQGHKYEEYILNIVNKSKKIMHGLPLTAVLSQSHGESDFIDINGRRYDAKLLLDTKQGQLIGDPKNAFAEWIKVMIKERGEYVKSISECDLSYVEETMLYRIMKDRIESLDIKENGILFIPFPIVNEAKGNVFIQFATDFLQAVYDKLEENKIVGKRKIYFIYPSMEPHIYVLRNAKRIREYIECYELEDFISFSTRPDIS